VADSWAFTRLRNRRMACVAGSASIVCGSPLPLLRLLLHRGVIHHALSPVDAMHTLHLLRAASAEHAAAVRHLRAHSTAPAAAPLAAAGMTACGPLDLCASRDAGRGGLAALLLADACCVPTAVWASLLPDGAMDSLLPPHDAPRTVRGGVAGAGDGVASPGMGASALGAGAAPAGGGVDDRTPAVLQYGDKPLACLLWHPLKLVQQLAAYGTYSGFAQRGVASAAPGAGVFMIELAGRAAAAGGRDTGMVVRRTTLPALPLRVVTWSHLTWAATKSGSLLQLGVTAGDAPAASDWLDIPYAGGEARRTLSGGTYTTRVVVGGEDGGRSSSAPAKSRARMYMEDAADGAGGGAGGTAGAAGGGGAAGAAATASGAEAAPPRFAYASVALGSGEGLEVHGTLQNVTAVGVEGYVVFGVEVGVSGGGGAPPRLVYTLPARFEVPPHVSTIVFARLPPLPPNALLRLASSFIQVGSMALVMPIAAAVAPAAAGGGEPYAWEVEVTPAPPAAAVPAPKPSPATGAAARGAQQHRARAPRAPPPVWHDTPFVVYGTSWAAPAPPAPAPASSS